MADIFESGEEKVVSLACRLIDLTTSQVICISRNVTTTPQDLSDLAQNKQSRLPVSSTTSTSLFSPRLPPSIPPQELCSSTTRASAHHQPKIDSPRSGAGQVRATR